MELNFRNLGLWFYNSGYSGLHRSLVISKISSGKAMGLDPMVDTWLKRMKNGVTLAWELYSILSGRIYPTHHINRARMMLLSKEDHPNPPINRIRPIQMYSALRKGIEA